MKKLKEIPECIGPVCDYDARVPRCATGFTWQELQSYREGLLRTILSRKGVTEPTLEMLCPKEVPTYEQYFDIKPPKKQKS